MAKKTRLSPSGTYQNAAYLSGLTRVQFSIHMVRLAVDGNRFNPATGRFGRDMRREPISRFAGGTAIVTETDGAEFGLYHVRSAARAAAVAAIKALRSGRQVSHNWDIEFKNNRGATYSETVWLPLELADVETETTDDDEKFTSLDSLYVSADELAELAGRGIDASDMDGWQTQNWEA